MSGAILAYLPSPSQNVWHLGPIPIRAYALCIIVGIVAAIWIGERRWVARGGRRGTVSDVAVWAVIFGLIGGRLYHVLTDPELYFGRGKDPLQAFRVWEGGLGIWGAIALGGVGAWIGCRRRGIKLPPFADAAAPGIAVAQGIGRWGNYFNQELFGKPTTLPWGVEISPDRPNTVPGAEAYHPTFLYESIWDFGLAGLLIWADRRFQLGRGRVFALYMMGYTVARFWIELLRIDEANKIFGMRVNVWTSVIVFLAGLIWFLRHPGPRETEVEPGVAAKAVAAEAEEPAEAEEVTEAEAAADAGAANDAASDAGAVTDAASDAGAVTDAATEAGAATEAERVAAADPSDADAEPSPSAISDDEPGRESAPEPAPAGPVASEDAEPPGVGSGRGDDFGRRSRS